MKFSLHILSFLLITVLVSCTTTPKTINIPIIPIESSKHFDRVLLIVMENEDYSSVIADPYFKEIADQGVQFTNFHAVAHPSYPNYMAMTGGETFGIRNDNQINIDQKSLGDLFNEKNLHWKNYAEGFPGKCYLEPTFKRYARKHVPMISYKNVQTHPEECSKIKSELDFQKDWKANQLPEYSFFTPNMDDDGHDKPLSFASHWLKKFLTPLLQDQERMQGTLIIVTFDEAMGDPTNQIYTAFIGPTIQPHTQSSTRATHYDVLRTIEDNFNLGTLMKNDSSANSIQEIWKK